MIDETAPCPVLAVILSSPTRICELRIQWTRLNPQQKLGAPSIVRSLHNEWETLTLNRLVHREPERTLLQGLITNH